jgi:outer membrane protein TolC
MGKQVLTLEECRALALKNSLEIQQARIETLTQQAIEYSNRTKLLPHLIFSTELSDRDNYAYSYSEILGQEGVIPEPGSTGTGVNQFSTGRERSTLRYILEARWSPTDAALAYYLTRSTRNEKLKQNYVRVRIAQKLIGVVDSSFFRLLSLQEAIPMAKKLVGMRRDLTHRSEKLFERQLSPVENYHKARAKQLRANRLLNSLVSEAEQQRNLLATAVYVSPETCVDGGFVVAGPLERPSYVEPICNMEMIAIKAGPEAYRAGLDHLSSVNDLKRTLVKYFPKVTLFWRYTRDKDKHQYNRDWKEVGGLVYFDLVEWGSNVWESEATELMVAKTRREIGAVAMGVTQQVRTAALRYYDALDQLKYASSTLASSRKVLGIQRERVSVDAQDRLALLEAEGDVLHEEIERIRAMGEANGLLAELKSTMGTNYIEPLAR